MLTRYHQLTSSEATLVTMVKLLIISTIEVADAHHSSQFIHFSLVTLVKFYCCHHHIISIVFSNSIM